MIEHEYKDFDQMMNDLKIKNGEIIAWDNPHELKLGWKLKNADEIWTIRLCHLKKKYKKSKIRLKCY